MSQAKKEIIFEAKLIVGESNPETSTAKTIDFSDINANIFQHCKNCYELRLGFCGFSIDF